MLNLHLLTLEKHSYKIFNILFIPLHQKTSLKLQYILVEPRWIEYLEIWVSFKIYSLNPFTSRTHNLPWYKRILFFPREKTATFYLQTTSFYLNNMGSLSCFFFTSITNEDSEPFWTITSSSLELVRWTPKCVSLWTSFASYLLPSFTWETLPINNLLRPSSITFALPKWYRKLLS